MYLDKNNENRNMHNMYDECKRLTNYHTLFTMKDGSVIDGIIESVDTDKVIIWVGEDVMDNERQYNPRRRFRRFRRRAFPLANLIALSLLPYPYYAPPYPYYPY